MCRKELQKRKIEFHMQRLVVSQFKTGLRHLSFVEKIPANTAFFL